jgi:DsbC/DsbD-like thiol-disulfide interchange protein
MIAIAFRLALIFGLSFSASALAARSDWTEADQARMRLLLAASEGERLAGGLELLMEPGWHTYWRNPGETGIPPQFDFTGSTNVASVDVLYPAPERYDDGGSVSLVYRNEVVFPLIVTPLRSGEAVVLHVKATFGICREVCVPTHAESALAAPARAQADPLTDARLAQFRTRVPKAPEAGRFDIEAVNAADGALLIDVRMPDSSYLDLFADPPEGWYIGQPELLSRDKGISRYRLWLAGGPEGGEVAGQTFRFVAVAGGEAIEERIDIR